MKTRKGFTLIELMLVIGIIMILIAAVVAGIGKARLSAERARCQELVANTATAMVQLFNDNGSWPKALINGGGTLNERAAYPLAKGGYMSFTTRDGQLSGYDRFGIVSPWAQAWIKKRGDRTSRSDNIPGGGKLNDHILRYALDLDGDGVIDNANIGGESVKIRANVAVWCCGKDGIIEAYSKGLKKDDVYSWSHGQTQGVR